MRINKDYEQEINIRDLFFDLAYRWRSILVAALICAIALGAFQYTYLAVIHGQGKITKEERQFQIDLQNYQDSMRNAQSSIRDYSKLIAEQNEYLSESIYMSLDSQKEWFSSKTYYIKMDQSVVDALPANSVEDPADYAAAVYVSMLTGSLDPAEMADVMGTDSKVYVDELVKIEADNLTNTVKLLILGVDEASVTRQMAFFADRMNAITETASQSVGPHTIAIVGEDTGTRLDVDLPLQKDTINKQIAEWQKALQEQRQILINLEDEEEPEAPGKHLVRYTVIGFVLGAFLLCGIYAVRYLFSDRLIGARQMQKRLELPVFGDVVRSRAKRSGKGLDGLFEKWEFGGAPIPVEAVYDGVSALLKERFTGKRVLLTGTVKAEELHALRDALDKRLGGACGLDARGGLPGSAEVIGSVKDADAVILVEEKRVSRMSEIIRAAELLQIGAADVQGCILL